MINGERIKRRGWSFLGIPEDQTSLHPTITSPRRIAEKNQETARLRFLRARRMAIQDDDEGAWGEDSFVAEPSDDESIPPDLSEFPLTHSGSYSLPLAILDPRLTCSSLKQSGDTSESGSTKERKKDVGVRQNGDA